MKTYISPAPLLFALAATLSGAAWAQTPPDAGSLQQQIERERQQQMPRRIAPDKPALPAAIKPAAGVTVTVKEYRFIGNTLLSNEQLAVAVAPYVNRPVDFVQLNAAAAAVADLYRAAGWVVRAYLPQQDIQKGVVTIQIVEAVFGKLHLEGTLPQRISAGRIEGIFTAQQASGAPLNAVALDRALLIADDLPGVSVVGSLVAGASERETDLVLKASDEAFVVGEAAIDNTGSRSTGIDRLSVNIGLNSPLGLGDLATANLIHSTGSDYVRLDFSLPLGSDGWRWGLNASQLHYRLVASEFSGLHGKGSSDTVGLEGSYPILRSRLANLFLNLTQDQKRFDNQSSGAITTRYTTDTTSIALNGNLFDNWGGGGANFSSLNWIAGRRKTDIGTTDQNFSKLKFSLSRQQVISNALSFYAALNGQTSGDRLDSSEKFYLGGANGVRAYPSSEGGGDSGVQTSLELRWRLPEGLILTGFHDYGRLHSSEAALRYSLQGYGLAIGWQAPAGINLKASWARRIGKNPNPTAAGNDQDGSLDVDRLWLSASLTF
ncbi:ShlB/FhaC/HecB family hemolysin secretion/activation protein [Roseateles cellulosilyticus]|uniref:BamA/TamA family outer membrane protein n=1 Tax=Pelomonas cellulosilytica TaxID=2906762 RepID=A0ABS8Y2K0_9BURK|nr:ShlB/FhaC/HecB family hemolysin secretion/activation protein [Pelomonas sp. P8]MCE4557958.1 BamA/TamA family outer membrane protein [Pelomonas sp. P8]